MGTNAGVTYVEKSENLGYTFRFPDEMLDLTVCLLTLKVNFIRTMDQKRRIINIFVLLNIRK